MKYQVNNVEGLDVSSQEVMGAYQCSFVTGKAVLGNVTVGTKAYNLTATVNGVEATFRVDPTYADDEQFAATNSLLQYCKPISSAFPSPTFSLIGTILNKSGF